MEFSANLSVPLLELPDKRGGHHAVGTMTKGSAHHSNRFCAQFVAVRAQVVLWPSIQGQVGRLLVP